MAWCGVPYPRRHGGGRPRYLAILEGLLDRLKTQGYSVETTSVHYVRCVALAREISATWGTLTRLGHSRDPWRMDITTLERWERMLKLARRAADTEYSRRSRLANLFALSGLPTITSLVQTIAARTVGSRYIAVEHIPVASARITVPSGSYPFGSVVSGAPWSSTVCHMLVLCQKLAGDTEGSFYEAMGQLMAALDPVMPAWMTFTWYREAISGWTSIPDGPSKAGFYCDDDHNLDNNCFSE